MKDKFRNRLVNIFIFWRETQGRRTFEFQKVVWSGPSSVDKERTSSLEGQEGRFYPGFSIPRRTQNDDTRPFRQGI
ncbi:hypothetical protein DPMN_034789 [Dreissena polymorpha]|uniref:Uncharacterized protein n=1 Tax=Dreissena polymorpha TaxID=45954 RepID=A0A9D4M9B5_DREPO|nr:hypothetical protein DPMN_034789 [Dreissena polymorpha]